MCNLLPWMKKNLYLLFTVFLYFWVQMEQRFVWGGDQYERHLYFSCNKYSRLVPLYLWTFLNSKYVNISCNSCTNWCTKTGSRVFKIRLIYPFFLFFFFCLFSLHVEQLHQMYSNWCCKYFIFQPCITAETDLSNTCQHQLIWLWREMKTYIAREDKSTGQKQGPDFLKGQHVPNSSN